MIVLDSDVVIDILRGIAPGVSLFSALRADEAIVVPGFCALEVLCGTRDSNDQRNAEKLLAGCKIVWLEPLLCQRAYQTLLQMHLSNAIGVLDVLVAHVAISLNQPLCTFNQKHFNAITELKTYRPYQR